MNEKTTRSEQGNLWLVAAGSSAIVLGLVFLVENLTGEDLDDLWGLAFLPMGLAALARAHRAYSEVGRVSSAAAGWIVIGLSSTAVALTLILQLDFGELWPVFFIIIGLGTLLTSRR